MTAHHDLLGERETARLTAHFPVPPRGLPVPAFVLAALDGLPDALLAGPPDADDDVDAELGDGEALADASGASRATCVSRDSVCACGFCHVTVTTTRLRHMLLSGEVTCMAQS